MVVGDETAIVGDEATLSPSIASSVPQADGYRLSILQGIAFKSELIATTPHHIEEDAEARMIVLRSGLCTPILRTEAEGVFVVACWFRRPIGCTIVFDVEANEVYANGRIELLEIARYLEHHCHSGSSIIGSHHRLAMLCGIGILIGPRTRIVVRSEDNALFRLRTILRNEVATREFCAVPSSHGGGLHGGGEPKACKLC